MQMRPSSRQSSSQAHGCRTQQRWPNLRRDKAIRLGQTTLEIVLFPSEAQIPSKESPREIQLFWQMFANLQFYPRGWQKTNDHTAKEKGRMKLDNYQQLQSDNNLSSTFKQIDPIAPFSDS